MSALVKENTKIGIIVAVLSSVIYGIYPAACRGAYADGANPVFVVFMTTIIRTSMLALFCFLTGKKLFRTKRDRKDALTGGLWQTMSVICVVTSLSMLPGPIVLIILFTSTIMLLFFMVWRGEAKLDAVTLGTTLSALLGLAFVLDIWNAHAVERSWLGIVLAFGAAIATFSRTYVYGTQMRERNPAVVGAESFLVVCGVLPLMMLWKLPVAPDHLSGWGWVLLSGLSLGLGSFGTFYGIALLGSFRLSLFMKIEPIFTSLFSVWFLGEYLRTSQYMGIGLVLVSLAAYQLLGTRFSKRMMKAEAQAEAEV